MLRALTLNNFGANLVIRSADSTHFWTKGDSVSSTLLIKIGKYGCELAVLLPIPLTRTAIIPLDSYRTLRLLSNFILFDFIWFYAEENGIQDRDNN